MNVFDALQSFWAGFTWPAWDENTVPGGDPALPYITYASAASFFDEPVPLYASLWDRGGTWVNVTNKAAEIAEAIGPGGKFIRYNGGVLWIKRGAPFIQRMPDDDPEIRRVYLVIEAENITNQ